MHTQLRSGDKREGERERRREREKEKEKGRDERGTERGRELVVHCFGRTFAVTIFDFIRFTWLINLHISIGLISCTDSQSCLLPLRSHKSCTDQISYRYRQRYR